MTINVNTNLINNILTLKWESEECNGKLAGGGKMKLILVMRRSRSKLSRSTESKERPL